MGRFSFSRYNPKCFQSIKFLDFLIYNISVINGWMILFFFFCTQVKNQVMSMFGWLWTEMLRAQKIVQILRDNFWILEGLFGFENSLKENVYKRILNQGDSFVILLFLSEVIDHFDFYMQMCIQKSKYRGKPLWRKVNSLSLACLSFGNNPKGNSKLSDGSCCNTLANSRILLSATSVEG